MPVVSVDEIENWIGRETGVSAWVTIDQKMINRFADLTDDHQNIHVDDDAAKAAGFVGTIAHGFLTLSILSKFIYEAGIDVEGAIAGYNYGFNRIRMIAPTPSGAAIRGRFMLKAFELKSPTRGLFTYDAVIEIQGVEKPALVAEWLNMTEFAAADSEAKHLATP